MRHLMMWTYHSCHVMPYDVKRRSMPRGVSRCLTHAMAHGVKRPWPCKQTIHVAGHVVPHSASCHVLPRSANSPLHGHVSRPFTWQAMWCLTVPHAMPCLIMNVHKHIAPWQGTLATEGDPALSIGDACKTCSSHTSHILMLTLMIAVPHACFGGTQSFDGT
eukprot:213420-Pelagomonas_calceolata.AAC.6